MDPTTKHFNEQCLEKVSKCIICEQLVRPPIYICSKLHISCFGCQLPYGECPLKPCVSQFRTSHFLGKLSQCLIYPCAKGCGVSLPLEELESVHEVECKHIDVPDQFLEPLPK